MSGAEFPTGWVVGVTAREIRTAAIQT